ncbi:hypothetical protein AGMMS49975_27960 [Clostridia bacterium]|nr:hypothetical protein AGMMS49975_27960 [Clostridia bacterium]
MGHRILVVDDEKLIVKGLKFSLEQDDMIVDTAFDGEEGLKLARDNAYSLIFLDVMLPKLDGIEVCQQIRVVACADYNAYGEKQRYGQDYGA